MSTTTRYIVRVDDVGQRREPSSELDPRLEEFMRWWEVGGWGAEPIYLGAVPEKLTVFEMSVLDRLERETKAEVCIHGWDHGQHVLVPSEIVKARAIFPAARCVIPPFNRYDERTISGCKALLTETPVLFGGLTALPDRPADHPYGPEPRIIDGVLHLSAEPALYKKAHELVDVVEDYPDPGFPVVLSLHARWDLNPAFPIEAVRALRLRLAGRMASVDEAWEWARAAAR